MGSNTKGQLGVNDPQIKIKYSPVLLEALVDKVAIELKCGDNHTVIACQSGEVYSWGCNAFGQTGGGSGRRSC